MALTKVTGQVINTTTDLVVGVTTVGGGISATDAYFSGITTLPNTEDSTSTSTGSLIVSGGVGIAKNLSIGGSVSIGGTLTYEDVTNIDSVGLITARNGVSVTGGNVSVTGGHVHLNDSKILKLGTDTDAQIVHTGAYGSINVSTGYFVNDIAGDWYVRNTAGTENRIIAKNNGVVELYNDGEKKVTTSSSGLEIYGTDGGAATLDLRSDEGTHDADKFRFHVDDGGPLYIRNYTSGSWETNILCAGNGDVELYYDNAKRLSTTSTGVDVQTPGAATYFRVLGGEGGDAILRLHADEGDDGPDVWSIFASQSDGKLKIQNGASGSWEDSINCLGDGAVELFYDNTKRFETNSTGAKFIGNLYADDNSELRLGDSGDLQLFHNSTSGEGRIYNSNAAGLILISNLIKLKNQANNETMLQATNGGAVELYYDNTLRVSTASAGLNVNLTSTDSSGTPDKYLNLYNDNDGANNMAGLRFAAASAANTDHWIYQKKHGAGNGTDLIVAHGSTERIRFVEGGGFTFNGDTAAANAIDDYEEGTFTPAVTSGLAGGSIAYNSRSGRYTKIGNVVTFTLHMNIASCSLDSGALKFGGLPKTVVDNGHIVGGCYLTMSNGNMGSDKTYRPVYNSTDIEVITAAGDAFAANSSTLNAGNRAFSIHGSYYAA